MKTLNKLQSNTIEDAIAYVKRNYPLDVKRVEQLMNPSSDEVKKVLKEKCEEWSHRLIFAQRHPEHKSSKLMSASYCQNIINLLSENIK